MSLGSEVHSQAVLLFGSGTHWRQKATFHCNPWHFHISQQKPTSRYGNESVAYLCARYEVTRLNCYVKLAQTILPSCRTNNADT